MNIGLLQVFGMVGEYIDSMRIGQVKYIKIQGSNNVTKMYLEFIKLKGYWGNFETVVRQL